MQQLTPRYSISSYPALPPKRMDALPYVPPGWDVRPLHPTPSSRLSRLALGRLRGDDSDGPSTATYITSGAGAAIGATQLITGKTVGSKIVGAGGVIAAAAPLAGPLAPVVAIAGAVVMALGTIATFLHVGEGCGQTCILTSQWADQAETNIRSLVNAYFSSPAPRLTTSRDATLRGFDAIWNQYAQACSNPALGQAGKNCTGDRERGACHFHQTGQSPWPGGPALGACWNWFSAYRDPVANDTQVVDPDAIDTSTLSSTANSLGSGLASALSNLDSKTVLLIGGALLLVGAMGD